MKVIETQTIADAHQKLVEYVYWNGIRMVTEDGQVCMEAEPVTVTIHNPMSNDSDMINKNSPAQLQKCMEYIKQIFHGAEGFEYTYHERLMEHTRNNGNDPYSIIACAIHDIRELASDNEIPYNIREKLKCTAFDLDIAEEMCFDYNIPVNQIQSCIDHLNEERMTRRAIAITWYPWKDPDTQHVPCLQFVQFKVRKQRFGFLNWFIGKKPKLDMYLLMRSNDVLGAFGQNAIGMASLQQYVADETDCKVGKYEHIVTIPHMYPIINAIELKRMIKC